MCADERQFERLLALHCAPVLKNRKASNMFHVEKDAFEDLHATLALYHEKLEKKGICLRLPALGQRLWADWLTDHL